MDQMELMKARHSVRQFTDKPLAEDAVAALRAEIDACNQESGLHIQLITNEPDAFQAEKPSYGQFKGCKNYLAIVGPKGKDTEAGYYGERIVLKALELGIHSCWVALTYKKGKTRGTENAGEKRYLVVALGYGQTAGEPHKVKALSAVSDYQPGDPDWYKAGLEAALLAPTAMNQRKFRFSFIGDRKVKARTVFSLIGSSYLDIDLGIVRYHFEIGAGKENFEWAE